MPKFNVYLLTTAKSWKGLEADNAEAAEDMVLDNEPLDCIRKSDEQWRLVSEEVEDDEILEDEGETRQQIEPGYTVRHEKGYVVHEVKISELAYDNEEDETSTV